jgi:hypothetical protein
VIATEMGHVLLKFDDAFLRLTSVLLAGQLGHNPTSVGCLADIGYTSSFIDSCVTPMEESTNFVLGVCAGDQESRLYQLPSLLSMSLWPPRTQVFGNVSWRTSTNVTSPPRTSLWMTCRPLAPTTAVAVRADSARLTNCRSRDASHVQHLLVRRSTRISWSHFPPRFKIATGTLSCLWTTIHDTCLPG